MAKNLKYTLKYRRRNQNKTDYNQRLRLLKSGKIRLVVRRSLNNFILQIVKYEEKGDKILTGVSSKELKKLGWKFSTKNIPAAYLTGLLLAKKSKEKEVIADFGLHRLIKGASLYAALKGVVDGGINIPHSDDIFPKEDRLKGEHIKKYKSDKEGIVKNFEEVKEKIMKS
ncbi:50S ribosomal protein L18 [archaeon]|nr:50S ribosomal protein L18 [archaeon]